MSDNPAPPQLHGLPLRNGHSDGDLHAPQRFGADLQGLALMGMASRSLQVAYELDHEGNRKPSSVLIPSIVLLYF